MTAPEIKPSRLVTPAQHQLFDIGYQVGMHASLFDQNLISRADYHDELIRENEIYRNDPPDSWDAYWLGRQVGYDIGHSHTIVACFATEQAQVA